MASRFDHFISKCNFEDLPSIFMGTNLIHQHQILQSDWKCEKGLKKNKNILFKKNIKNEEKNPRKCGVNNFIAKKSCRSDIAASEYIQCTGKFGCEKINSKCPVKIKLTYFIDGTCKIYSNGAVHGEKFKTEQTKSKKLDYVIKEKIISLYNTDPSLTPLQIKKILKSDATTNFELKDYQVQVK